MPLRIAYALATGALLLTVAIAQAPKQEAPLNDAQKAAFYDAEVKPILTKSCFPCHSGDDASGGLNLANRDALLKGGISGKSVLPETLQESLLVRAIHYDGKQMPPQGKLPAAQIATLTKWVALGVPYGASKTDEPVHTGPPQVNAENKKFWSFQPVKRPAIPKVTRTAWVRNPVDAFVLANLEKHKLGPAPTASRESLIRRAYFDLIGLPPTPQEVAAFVNDKSPNAWEKVVDRLLASPQYGERWGRHWLDLVRYAETNSYERDGDKPFVWKYRDYVIKSFNQDKPYNQFVMEQLAGDELDTVTPDSLIATGYYRLGLWDDEPADPKLARFDDLDDIASTTGQTFLGLTVGCARCHDHKIDPIPTKDYYQFLSFFSNINRYGVRSNESVFENSIRPISPESEQKRFAVESEAFKGKLKTLDIKIREYETLVRPDLGGGEVDDFKNESMRPMLIKKRVPKLLTEAQYGDFEVLWKQREELRNHPPKGLDMALCVTETGPTAAKSFIMIRGNADSEGEEVTPKYLSILSPPEPVIKARATTSGRRRALAEWLVDGKNPMTARVMANRVFQFHFGRGIVRSSSNFGFLGTNPTHPELLDYLATELVRNGWKLKPLHKQIMMSNAYKMSSKVNPVAIAKDPENDLLWRFDMRRLESEEVRDSILAVSGNLNTKMYGQSITVQLPQEVLAGQSVPGQGWGKTPYDEQCRRSVYVKIKRSLAVPILASYDAADTDATCPVRFTTTQPTQALGMMNSAWVNEQAGVFAKLAKQKAGNDPTAQAKFVLSRVLQRPATPAEVQRGVKLMKTLKTKHQKTPDEALTAFCLVSLNLNEFVYLD